MVRKELRTCVPTEFLALRTLEIIGFLSPFFDDLLFLFPVILGVSWAVGDPPAFGAAQGRAAGVNKTARRLKQLVGQIFRFAIVTGRAKRDPSSDLKDALRATGEPQRHRAMPLLELPTFLQQSLLLFTEHSIAVSSLSHQSIASDSTSRASSPSRKPSSRGR